MYGKQGLYCGEDGLPHLVTSGDWNHAGEFMVSLANVPQIGGRSIADPYHGRAADDNFAPVYQPFTTTLSPFAGRMTSRRQLPGVAFLYVAGVIGWAGRAYLIRSRSSKNPTQMEYIIDVPVALECFGEAAGWPFKAVQELRTGELTEDEDKITVSPR